MTAELHLPDLPDVPVTLSAPAGSPRRTRLAWSLRLRGLLGTSLPLLLMALLALGTWWLVKNSPKSPTARPAAEVTHVPDYTVDHFTVERFDATGRRVLRMEGEHLRHFPDTDEVEVDTVRLVATGPDGRLTQATARLGVAAGDGSVVRLEGGAQVVSSAASGVPVEIRGEHLLAQVRAQRVLADRPVEVRQGQSVFTADALEHDQAKGQLLLKGKVRGTFFTGGVLK
jgi:lipopolysaccharide export system protein LptC